MSDYLDDIRAGLVDKAVGLFVRSVSTIWKETVLVAGDGKPVNKIVHNLKTDRDRNFERGLFTGFVACIGKLFSVSEQDIIDVAQARALIVWDKGRWVGVENENIVSGYYVGNYKDMPVERLKV